MTVKGSIKWQTKGRETERLRWLEWADKGRENGRAYGAKKRTGKGTKNGPIKVRKSGQAWIRKMDKQRLEKMDKPLKIVLNGNKYLMQVRLGRLTATVSKKGQIVVKKESSFRWTNKSFKRTEKVCNRSHTRRIELERRNWIRMHRPEEKMGQDRESHFYLFKCPQTKKRNFKDENNILGEE